MSTLNERSGKFTANFNLVAFVYELLRDRVLPGDMEGVVDRTAMFHTNPDDDEPLWTLTNGWLAKYARDTVRRLILDDRERDALKFAFDTLNYLDDDTLSDEERALRMVAMTRLGRFIDDV